LNGIARMPANERAEVFSETAERKGLPEAIIEKDFWVSWVLKQLFSIDALAGRLVFKGGTSLSKIFHAIKRTFWEKATILHAEYHRPPEKPLPDRYSRHYYDVAMLAEGTIRSEALGDMTLLAQVVRHKETFYPSGWAHYDLARPGSLRLMPPETRVAALERDYRNMNVMVFGEPPAFEKIMETLAALEEEINR
jgi:hypothetical protein